MMRVKNLERHNKAWAVLVNTAGYPEVDESISFLIPKADVGAP